MNEIYLRTRTDKSTNWTLTLLISTIINSIRWAGFVHFPYTTCEYHHRHYLILLMMAHVDTYKSTGWVEKLISVVYFYYHEEVTFIYRVILQKRLHQYLLSIKKPIHHNLIQRPLPRRILIHQLTHIQRLTMRVTLLYCAHSIWGCQMQLMWPLKLNFLNYLELLINYYPNHHFALITTPQGNWLITARHACPLLFSHESSYQKDRKDSKLVDLKSRNYVLSSTTLQPLL